MTIETILKNKPNVVFTTTPDTFLGDIVGTFSRNEAGSLLVVDHSDMLVGVLTERDTLRALGEQGAAALALPVSAAMARVKFRCRPQDTIARALELMRQGRTRYLPVAENGRLIGVISMSDMITARLRQEQEDNDWMREYICADYSISYRHNS